MQKIVNIKTKTGLKSNIIVRDFNIDCFRSHCSSNNIILRIQTQEKTINGPRSKEAKAKDLKLALPYINVAESSKQGRKNKKKKTKEHR